MNNIKLLAKLLPLLLLLFGCSTTKKISETTVETETIKPMEFNVPEVKGETELSYLFPDEFLGQPYGDYEVKDIDLKNDTKENVNIKAKLIKKDGKPRLKLDLSVKQSPVKVEAKVLNKTTTTKLKEEIEPFNPFKYIIYVLFLAVLFIVVRFLFKR